jgi:hypothetical protein
MSWRWMIETETRKWKRMLVMMWEWWWSLVRKMSHVSVGTRVGVRNHMNLTRMRSVKMTEMKPRMKTTGTMSLEY